MMIVSLDRRKQTLDEGNTTYKGIAYSGTMFSEHNSIMIDESDMGSSNDLIIVGSYVRLNDLDNYLNVGKTFPKSKGPEVKYRKVNPSDRIMILREINEVTFEVWDSSEYRLPSLHQMRSELTGYVGNKNPETTRYIYTIKKMLEDILSTHNEKTNVYVDSVAKGSINDMLAISKLLVDEGYQVEFFRTLSSRHSIYLQVHDFVTGFDRDIQIGSTANTDKFPDQDAVEKLISRFKNKKRRRYP